MSRRTGLGRGLEALIPGGDRQADLGVRLVPVEAITPNPRQPRTHFDPEELSELTESVRTHGVIQPLIVTYAEDPAMFVLVAGERRLLAARQAGLEKVPVLVRDASDQQRLELALIENLQRADLAPLEAAEAFRHLSEDFQLSHEEIAARVGKSRTAVTNTLRLLKLSPAVQQALAEGKISEGHARVLVPLPTVPAQNAALHTILVRELNVRQTEELVRQLLGDRPPAAPKPATPPEVAALEERLRACLGTRVSLNRRRKGGTLVIHFYSDEELDALVRQIVGDDENSL